MNSKGLILENARLLDKSMFVSAIVYGNKTLLGKKKEKIKNIAVQINNW